MHHLVGIGFEFSLTLFGHFDGSQILAAFVEVMLYLRFGQLADTYFIIEGRHGSNLLFRVGMLGIHPM